MASLWKRYLAALRGSPRPSTAEMTMGVGFTFRDDDGDLVAAVWPDSGTKVYQPDKIRSCGDALVEHLAEVAAKEAAEKEFGDAP